MRCHVITGHFKLQMIWSILQTIPAIIGVFFRYFLYFVELPQQQRFRTVAKDCKLDIVSLWHTRSLEWGLHTHIALGMPHNTKLFRTLFKKTLTPCPLCGGYVNLMSFQNHFYVHFMPKVALFFHHFQYDNGNNDNDDKQGGIVVSPHVSSVNSTNKCSLPSLQR